VSEPVEEPATPDFADVYRTSEYVTPRMAWRPWTAARICGDTWHLATGDLNVLLKELPPIARSFATGPWLERLVGSFDALAKRIGDGAIAEKALTACTGEEMALHMVIDFAEGHFDSGLDADDQLEQLPDRGSADSDFELMRDVHLHPSRWFLRFDDTWTTSPRPGPCQATSVFDGDMTPVHIKANQPPVLTSEAAAVLARLVRQRIEAAEQPEQRDRRLTDAA
jgi:hypothetical protein